VYIERGKNFFASLEHHFEQSTSGKFLIIPEATICDCGCELTLRKCNAEPLFVHHVFVPNIKIYNGVCANGCPPVHFDGHDIGLVNYANKLIFTVEILRECLNISARSGTSVSSWWQAKCDSNLDFYPSELKSAQRQKWKNLRGAVVNAAVGFTELLDIPDSLFYCCANPRAVSMDGVVLSVKSHHLPKFDEPWIKNHTRERASTRPQRNVLKLTEDEQKLTHRLLAKHPSLTIADCESVAGISDNVGFQLFIMLSLNENTTQIPKCPKYLENFARSLYKTISPACQLLPLTMSDLVQVILQRPNQLSTEERTHFMAQSPILFKVYSHLCKTNAFPDTLVGILFLSLMELLLETTFATFAGSDESAVETVTEEIEIRDLSRGTCQNKDLRELWATGMYFPGRSIKRTIDRIKLQGERVKCTKLGKSRNVLGPGHVFFWCVEHGMCIGSVHLAVAESPQVVCEVLASRFDPIPPIIMYDNACNLHEYALNRYPKLFKDSLFLVDGFHFASHTNCAPTYDSTGHALGKTSSLNSSLSEQKNKVIGKQRLTAPLMRFRTNAAFVRYGLARMNLDELDNTNNRNRRLGRT
jgi:hypothetical protein